MNRIIETLTQDQYRIRMLEEQLAAAMEALSRLPVDNGTFTIPLSECSADLLRKWRADAMEQAGFAEAELLRRGETY